MILGSRTPRLPLDSPPVGGEQSVGYPVLVLAPFLVVLTHDALSGHPYFLHHPTGGEVAAEARRVDAVELQVLEGVADGLPGCLGRVRPALRPRGDSTAIHAGILRASTTQWSGISRR
jgi:hypothetical protein